MASLFSRERLTLLLVLLAIEFVIFFSGTIVPINPAQQQDYTLILNDLKSVTQNSSPMELFVVIFSHNLALASLEMIPVFGVLFFGYSLFVTGQVFQAGALSYGVSGPVAGLVTFLLPFALVEFSAYVIAAGSGLMVVVAMKRRSLKREARVFGLEALLVVLILAIAAAMETISLISVWVGLLLWVPTGIAIAWIILLSRRVVR